MARICACMLVLFLELSAVTIAQTRVGFHGGAQIATLNRPQNRDEHWNWLGKASGGVTLDLSLAEHVLAVFQVDLVEKWSGGRTLPLTLTADIIIYHMTLRTRYLEIPFYIRWRPGNGGFRWFAEIGPKTSFLLSADADLSALQGLEWTVNVEERVHSTDVGIAVGSGVEIDVARSVNISFAAHYTHGLVSFFRDSSNDSKVISFQVDVGVMIDLQMLE